MAISRFTSFFFLSSLTLGACSSQSTTTASSGPTVTADPTKMGMKCSFASDPGTLAATVYPDCGEGVCVADLREDRPATYCSVDCDEKLCPEGYVCEPVTVDRGVAKVCTRLPSVCGDGEVQAPEACDDGNTSDDDFCSADCSEVVKPQGVVQLTSLTLDGARILDGAVPVVYHAEQGTRPCGSYQGAASSGASGRLITVAPVLCTPEGRRFLLALSFHQVGTEYELLSSSAFAEIDENGKMTQVWDVGALSFGDDPPPQATVTNVSTDASGVPTSVQGTLSVDADTFDKTSNVKIQGTFSFDKLGR